MKILSRWWIVAALVAVAQTLPAAEPGTPGGPGEYRDFKVLKSYRARSGDHLFQAYVIEWEGQQVVALDVGALVKARSDDTINVLISRGLPRPDGSTARIMFLARPEKRPPLDRSQIVGATPEALADNPPVRVELRVSKVYALQNNEYVCRAYEVEWEGQEVIVPDHSASTTYDVGDKIVVLVAKQPYPDDSKPYGLLSFQLLPARFAVPVRRR